MEAPLKQRIIGAIVLAALALIFVPMLLKSPNVKNPDSADVPIEIPDEPNASGMKTVDIVLEPDVAPIAIPPPVIPKQADAVPAKTSSSVEAVTPDTVYTAAGQYALIVPATSNEQANRLLMAMQKLGLSGKIQSNGKVFRLRIGPYSSREQAEIARLRSNSVASGATVVALDAQPSATPATQADVATTPTTTPVPVKPVVPTVKPAVVENTPKSIELSSSQAVVKPAVKPSTVDSAKGFAVQIGAPASEQAAITLRDKARAAGFSSFIQAVETENGRRFRVRVGPEHSRAEADLLQSKLQQKISISGIVVVHP